MYLCTEQCDTSPQKWHYEPPDREGWPLLPAGRLPGRSDVELVLKAEWYQWKGTEGGSPLGHPRQTEQQGEGAGS